MGKAKEFLKNICFIYYAKAFDCVNCNKLWKILKEMGMPEHFTCILKNLYSGQEETKPDMKQLTGSQFGKGHDKAVYYHTDYLTSMQSISCKMPSLMNPKVESRLLGEIPITSDMQITPAL